MQSNSSPEQPLSDALMEDAAHDPSHREERGESSAWLSGGRGLILGLCLGVAIALGVTALMARPAKEKGAAPGMQSSNQGSRQSVRVSTVAWRSVAQTIPVQGSVEARNWVSVMPKAPGVQIKSIAVEEGQSVRQGEAIAVLDNSVQQEQLNQARAQVASSQAQLAAAQTQLSSAQAQAEGSGAQLASAQAAVAQKQAQIAQQQANFNEAESNRQRYLSLAKQGAISTQELESRNTAAISAQAALRVAQTDIQSAQAGLRNAAAQLAQSKAAVNNARAGVTQARANQQSAIARQRELETQLQQASLVLAPASGVIAKKNANVGDLTSNTPLFSIIQNEALELQAKVPETLLSKVQVGAIATVTSDSDRRIRVAGTVREIDPVVDAKTRQALVKIGLPTNALLKPGMFLRAAIAYGSTQALTVPSGAVVPQPDGQMTVYVVAANNTVQARTVELGDLYKDNTVVKKGLNPSDRVVVSGAGFLKDGDQIKVVE
ncbi:MAG TPA: efflux RND transporter periplasmic adaptor subunit [Stenomitos sp.]